MHPGRRAAVMGDVVELSLPVDADLLVLARLTAATIASRAGFDVEEVEDFRLAVDELCVSLIQEGSDGRLRLQFTRDVDSVEVSCSYDGSPAAGEPATGEDSIEGLSARILDALVDAHGREIAGGQERAWLRKRRARQEA
jgi:anti-sigma regulatory factor (Ser/Thr protein kinase)